MRKDDKTYGWNFLVATQFATKVQLKNLTHMFCPSFSSWKLYNKGAFFYIFTF
jgi:hypothetical protein